jgi:hypothetical protein
MLVKESTMEESQVEETVTLIFDGKEITVPAGISVAAAVLGHTHPDETYTNPVDGSPRAPYCLMGVCFECMLEVNGEPNVQSCLVAVQEGMVVKRQLQTGEAK